MLKLKYLEDINQLEIKNTYTRRNQKVRSTPVEQAQRKSIKTPTKEFLTET